MLSLANGKTNTRQDHRRARDTPPSRLHWHELMPHGRVNQRPQLHTSKWTEGRASKQPSRSNSGSGVHQAPWEQTRIKFKNSVHFRDTRPAPSQSEKTRAMNTVTRQTEMAMRAILKYDGHVQPQQAPLARLGHYFQLNWNKTRNETQHLHNNQPRMLNACASCVSKHGRKRDHAKGKTEKKMKNQLKLSSNEWRG